MERKRSEYFIYTSVFHAEAVVEREILQLKCSGLSLGRDGMEDIWNTATAEFSQSPVSLRPENKKGSYFLKIWNLKYMLHFCTTLHHFRALRCSGLLQLGSTGGKWGKVVLQ